MRALALLVVATGCYSARSASSDINAAWRGRARVDLEARIGAPTQQAQQPDGTLALRWVGHGYDVVAAPSAYVDLKISPAAFSLDAEAKPGVIERTELTRALAVVAPTGSIVAFDGAFAANFPDGLNARTGLVMGLSGAMGAFADASTPFPSMGAYIGGMVGPRTALVGSYAFVNGKADAGYAMAHAVGFGVQHWPAARFNVRASGAAVLDLDPGLENPTFAPGGMAAASYAIVRSGSFVLDARFDAIPSTSAAFGMFGVGVNVN
jgi:hypothetical protein